MGGIREEFELILQELLEAVKEVYGKRLVSLAVFGSVGRGTPTSTSDIDLLVVAEELPRGRLARVEEFDLVEELLLRRLPQLKHVTLDLSPVLKEKKEVIMGSLLFLDMLDDARILYDKDLFLAKYFEEQRRRLQELGALRRPSKGAWHWVLKKDFRRGEGIEL